MVHRKATRLFHFKFAAVPWLNPLSRSVNLPKGEVSFCGSDDQIFPQWILSSVKRSRFLLRRQFVLSSGESVRDWLA